jgi:hypothetical protein
MRKALSQFPAFSVLCGFLLALSCAAPLDANAEPAPAVVSVFNAYVAQVESRLARQHSLQQSFLVPAASDSSGNARLRSGELMVQQLTPTNGMELPGALLHHWRATAFLPGVRAANLERLMKDFNAYPQIFAPQVLQSKVLWQREQGSSTLIQASLRVRQQHVITVVMDSAYDVAFQNVDAQRGYSISRSTRIAEVASPGTASEHPLNAQDEHGFLWRQHTYWTWEERDGGLYMQVESVSLSRSLPYGVGWAVRPFVESVPRESLEFTLRSVCNALRK